MSLAAHNALLNSYSPAGRWLLGDALGNFADSGSGGDALTPSGTVTREVEGPVPGALGATFVSGAEATSGSAVIDLTGDATVLGWFKGSFSASVRLFKQFAGGSDQFSGLVLGNGNLSINHNGTLSQSASSYGDDVWHQLAVTRTGNDNQLYVDRVLVAGPTSVVDATTPNSTFDIAGLGTISLFDMAVINGTGLSAAQIKALYDAMYAGGPQRACDRAVDRTKRI